MAEKIFKETGDLADKPVRDPFDHNTVKTAADQAGPRIRWFNDDTEPSWSPYCVRIVDLATDGTLTFRYVSSEVGKGGAEVQGECKVNINNLKHVWADHPSTIDRTLKGAPPASKEYAMLFLSTEYTKTTPQAATSGGTESKWPKGSEWFALVRKLCRFVPPQPHSFSDSEKALLELAGAEWL
jgi:hypothetical protein